LLSHNNNSTRYAANLQTNQTPNSVIAVIALATVVLALIKRRQRLALWVGGQTLIGLVTLSILPLGNVLLQPIERAYSTNPHLTQIDSIIVLGGGENVRASNY